MEQQFPDVGREEQQDDGNCTHRWTQWMPVGKVNDRRYERRCLICWRRQVAPYPPREEQ